MRVKYDKELNIIRIILKEEPDLYFDECQQFRFLRPMEVYYSEKGEPAEIRIYQTIDEEKSEKEEEEVTVPDFLHWRNYIFTIGKNTYGKRYQGCVDRYSDIGDYYDWFSVYGLLTIHQRDGREMEKNEIKEIRENFFEDIYEYLPHLLDEDSIVSLYKNKILYFWTTEERMSYPSSEEEFLKFIQNSFEWILNYSSFFDEGKGVKLKKRNIGFDLSYPDYELALVCIYDGDYRKKCDMVRIIKKEELVDIYRNMKKYENRRIVLLDAELSETAIDYAKSQNIKIQNIRDVIREKVLKESEFNDENADNIDIQDIFDDDYEKTPPNNKKTTDNSRKEKHKKPIEYPEPSDGSFILKDSRPFGSTKAP